MQQIIQLQLLPSDSMDSSLLREHIAARLNRENKEITGFNILKRSIDARSKQTWMILLVNVFIGEPYQERSLITFNFKEVSKAKKKVIVIGAGPAGLFAALKLIEAGIQPILLERGKEVRARRCRKQPRGEQEGRETGEGIETGNLIQSRPASAGRTEIFSGGNSLTERARLIERVHRSSSGHRLCPRLLPWSPPAGRP